MASSQAGPSTAGRKRPAGSADSVRRIGITEVHVPADGAAADVDIILVHGLFGHPRNTWTSNTPSERAEDEDVENGAAGPSDYPTGPPAKRRWFNKNQEKELFSEVFWPGDLLPDVFPKARIMTWGYDVNIDGLVSSASQARVFHHAESLLMDLHVRRPTDAAKAVPIIFIAHSLGGIVVKDALNLCKAEAPRFGHVLAATGGVLFLGTPHHGSKVASLGKLALEASRLFLRKPNLDVLRALETNNEVLERISRSFGHVAASGTLRIHSFWEELPTMGVLVVERHSAVMGYPTETRGSLYASHRDMARFPFADHVNFGRIVAVLKSWVNELTSQQQGQGALTTKAQHRENHVADEKFETFYKTVLNSLCNTAAQKRFHDVDDPYLDTFEWIFNVDCDFCKWLQGRVEQPFFWVRGKPASGKSTAMKFAVRNWKTAMLLRAYDDGDWVIVDHFFHDRGSHVQKSTKGLLQEVLYQIFAQDRSIFAAMYDYFQGQRQLRIPSTRLPSIDATVSDTWTVSSLRDALRQMRFDVKERKNICLFIDAMDEHNGDHKVFLSVLDLLRRLSENPMIKLRACVASRPEAVFRERFRGCPGFAMDVETVADVRKYVEGRLEAAVSQADLNPDGVQIMQSIIQKINNRAEGVFMWVRLVIDELVEGLSEGNTFSELDTLLDSIPSELSELYTRTLLRKRDTTPSSLKRETYIMFSMASLWHMPWRLGDFLAATLLFSSNSLDTAAGIACLSASQMLNRLYSRSNGLLEVHSRAMSPSDLASADVQFIHQTLKEYMVRGDGLRVLHDSLPAGLVPEESGGRLLCRCLARWLCTRFEISPKNHVLSLLFSEKRLIAGFAPLLRLLERDEGFCVGAEFEHAIAARSEAEQARLLYLLLSGSMENSRESSTLRRCSGPKSKLVFFYVTERLALSVDRARMYNTMLVEADIVLLYEAATRGLEAALMQECIMRNFSDLVSVEGLAKLEAIKHENPPQGGDAIQTQRAHALTLEMDGKL